VSKAPFTTVVRRYDGYDYNMIVLAKQWLLCKNLFFVTHAKGKRRISSARLLRALFCFETRAPAKPWEMGEGLAFILES
jgi:hypothetical protein